MRIKSLLYEDNIEFKTIVLKKSTAKAQTSEEYFGISSQPPNTCPHIDETIKSNDLLRYDEFLEILSYPQESISSIENCACCGNAEILAMNLINLKKFKDSIKIHQNKIDNINKKLEIFRNDCSNLRNYGTIIKDTIWAQLESTEDSPLWSNPSALLKNEKPEIKSISFKEFKRLYAEMDLRASFQETLLCKDKCSNFIKNEKIIADMETWPEGDYSIPHSLEDAFDNFNKIIEWVKNLDEYRFDKDIQNKIKASFTLEASLYLSLINDSFSDVFEKTLQSYMERPLLPLNSKELLFDFELENENLYLSKQLEEYIDQINKFSIEFNLEARDLLTQKQFWGKNTEKKLRRLLDRINELNETAPDLINRSTPEKAKSSILKGDKTLSTCRTKIYALLNRVEVDIIYRGYQIFEEVKA